MQEYNETDQQLHWLCQIIAKANRTFVAQRKDDSHTNLYFDPLGKRILGRWIETPKGNCLLTFNLTNLHFEWLNTSRETIRTVQSVGKYAGEIEKELSKGIREMGLDPNGFTNELHFEIPDYSFSREIIREISQPRLNEWQYYRRLANDTCALVLGYLQVDGEIRIWPHHFDTGIYVPANEKTGIGYGLAMEDNLASSPYFYMAGYPAEGTLNYESVPTLHSGRWEIGEHWQGAILPIAEIDKLNGEEIDEAVSSFLLKTINWFVK